MRNTAFRAFLATSALLAAPCLIAVLRTDRFALHLAVNACHGPFGDRFVPWLTELASGWVPALLAAALLFKNWRAFLMMGLSTGLSALIAQFLKRAVFFGHDRPAMYLDRMPGLHLVPGLELHQHFSFPSGHGTAAFSMCLALSVIVGKRAAGIFFALVAALLAWSRVYLSQHFTEDVLAGALLGTLVAAAVFGALYHGRWAASEALGRSPFRR